MSTFRTSDGIEIRYEQLGDGPPVYVCHGGPSNICDTLCADLAPLTEGFRLVFHDYRGSGESEVAPPASYRFDRLARDLDELRDHLGDDSVSVLAHSMGGFVALEYALGHQSRCDRLALVGTSPCGVSKTMAIPSLRALGLGRTVKALGLGLLFLALWSWRRPGQERTKAMYAPMSVTQESRRALRGRVADAHPDLPVDNDNAQHLLKAMGGLDLRGRLGDLSCPVLVLYGSRDAVMVVGGEMLSARLPSAQVRVLPDVGHEPFIETPGETFAILRGFLVG